MKKTLFALICLAVMLSAGMSLKAQEVTITLAHGWNWISYPNAEAMQVGDALGDFIPMNGDMIQSQFANSKYTNGRWRGGVTHFMPGWGYMYYSARTDDVEFVFSTPPMPTGTLTVTTSEPTNITSTTAVCGGSAVSNDGTTILMKGICWATHPEPTTNDLYSEIESGPGTFTSAITELAPETVYYVRAYAVSVKGINYGEELSFTTVSPGILNGLFSVSENIQVCFSQGNLQYQASTNTWRFAENQWDYVGEGNANASSTYDGWIDLFSWGTSGYDLGVVWYQPWSSSGDDAAYGNDDNDLCDGNGQADWGYNAISNGGNQEMQWRTCRVSEWQYLLETRQTTSGIRFAKAVVNGINGLVLLPDNWNSSIYELNNTNEGNTSYEVNVISSNAWTDVLEANGAVFLPAAGRIQSWTENDFGIIGCYWSSTSCISYLKFLFEFNDDFTNPSVAYYTDERYAVRLIRSEANAHYSIEAISNPTESGTISGTGIYDYYTTAALTAIPNEGYSFYQWKEHGNVVSTESTYGVVALFDRNLEAVFYETSTYPLHYSFNANDHTATVTGHLDGQNATGDLVIPETVMHNGETYTVTAIGEYAFGGCSNLTSVEFPSSLVSIGHMAFFQCSNLTSFEFPSSLESISDFAFGECNGITDVFIPSSVTQIGKNPFTKCSNLSQITVESGNIYYDSRDDSHAIIETATNKLVSGSFTSIIPNTVTSIGEEAFWGILVPSITIPASMNYIAPNAIRIYTLSSMTVLAEVPPTLDWCAFCDTDHSIPVYVPCGSIEAYQNVEGWNEFTNIIELCPGVVTVTANHEEYGTVSGGGSFEAGETCTVTATSNEGYYFLCWIENGQVVSTEATYTFPVYRDHDLTAIFYASIGAENVVNGDFEQGNVGFSSEYEYLMESAPGGYIVDDNANMYNGGFHGLGHGGTGKFMIIDGATEPDVIVWTEQLSVVPNTYYTLSAWVCTLIPESLALLQFSINGTQIGDVFMAPSQTNTWQQFSAIWYSGNSTTATITIIDLNTSGDGNDFGLDDISFRELDPSASGDHAYVDLGLPSGLLWATCNVGADAPEDYGDYFAWGETQPKDIYSWSTYQHSNGGTSWQNPNLTKYCTNSSYGYNGFTDNLTTLLPEDDAATANWGSDWRMPTQTEWQELLNNTTVTWTQQNGVYGRLFTASNGNSLFLPAAGARSNSSLYGAGSHGDYWSSSLNTDYPSRAWDFYFSSGNYYMSYDNRYCGQSVRPVRSASQN